MKVPSLKPMNVVLYLRVSTTEQVTNFSLDTQEELCRTTAQRLGYNIIRIFREEGESAKTADRPQLIQLLEYCRIHKNEIHSVMVYRIDRMARETSDYLTIRKHLASYGIRLESATEPTGDSPTSKFLETIFAANAELDNAIRGERAKNGLYKRFRSGYPLGLPPLGYKLSETSDKRKILIPDEPKFSLVKNCWEMLGTGTKTIGEMVEIMRNLGLKTNFKNVPMAKSYVAKLFKNSMYCGLITSPKYPGEEVRGSYTPMITRGLFNRVQEIVRSHRTNGSAIRLVHNPEFPLRGLIICHKCQKPLVSGNVHGKTKIYPMYWCQNCRGSRSIKANELEGQLKYQLKELQPTPDTLDSFLLIVRATYHKSLESLETSRKNAVTRLAELNQMYNALVDGYLKKKFPDDIYQDQRQKIEEQIISTKVLLDDSICEKYDLEGTMNFMKALLFDLARAYEVSDYGQKRQLLSSIYPSGILYKDGLLLNSPISPLWSAIKSISRPSVLLSADESPSFELFLSSLRPLILAYPDYQEQFNYL